jgi:NAD(P)-dependent dehydrogenase (short-subunit alcohol dehydrogenase family)
MSSSLLGKRFIITGGTEGIGKAVAVKLVQAGASVLLIGRNIQKGQSALTDLKRLHINDAQQIEFRSLDVTNIQEVSKFCSGITFPLTGLLECAGGLNYGNYLL